MMPAYIVLLPPSVDTVFVAETSTATFHRYGRTTGQLVEQVSEDYMSIGAGGAGKQVDGDGRTPLGVYLVTEKLDTTRLHEKYGPMAFPLDYPNAWDRLMRRSGDGIWVHGVDRRGGRRPPLDTDGCLALPNESLAALEDFFQPNVTPVIITEVLDLARPDEIAATRAELEAAVNQWGRSLQRGDLHAFLSLYGEEFRHWGMDLAEWQAFVLETLGQRTFQRVDIRDLMILGDPQEQGLYLSRFTQTLVERGAADTPATVLTRRLYWRRSRGGAFRIVAEDSG